MPYQRSDVQKVSRSFCLKWLQNFSIVFCQSDRSLKAARCFKSCVFTSQKNSPVAPCLQTNKTVRCPACQSQMWWNCCQWQCQSLFFQCDPTETQLDESMWSVLLHWRLKLELLRRGFSFFWDSKDKKLGSRFKYHPLTFKAAIWIQVSVPKSSSLPLDFWHLVSVPCFSATASAAGPSEPKAPAPKEETKGYKAPPRVETRDPRFYHHLPPSLEGNVNGRG